MWNCLRQKRPICFLCRRSKIRLGLLDVEQSTQPEKLSEHASNYSFPLTPLSCIRHRASVTCQEGCLGSLRTRIIEGARLIVETLAPGGHPRQSSKNAKAKWYSRSFLRMRPAKLEQDNVQTRNQLWPGGLCHLSLLRQWMATYLLWESRYRKRCYLERS